MYAGYDGFSYSTMSKWNSTFSGETQPECLMMERLHFDWIMDFENWGVYKRGIL